MAAALSLWLPPEPAPAARPTLRDCDRPARSATCCATASLVATYAVGFCVLFTQVAMFTYVTFHLAAPPFSLSTVALGWLFVVYLVGAAVTPFAGRWIDRLRPSRRASRRRWRSAPPARC